MDNSAFIAAHPELANDMTDRYGDLDWIKRYTDVGDNGRINRAWERDVNGNLVDVTEREKAREELELAKEALERLRLQEAKI